MKTYTFDTFEQFTDYIQEHPLEMATLTAHEILTSAKKALDTAEVMSVLIYQANKEFIVSYPKDSWTEQTIPALIELLKNSDTNSEYSDLILDLILLKNTLDS